MSAESRRPSVKWAAVTLGVVVAILAASVAFLTMQPPKKITNFEECVDAGGGVMESYPEQCLYNGKTYVNEDQIPPKDSGFEGMEESEALLMAEENGIPARVVERDGESLPVTMDLMPGRHNFYVNEGVVYNVEIENEPVDSPN